MEKRKEKEKKGERNYRVCKNGSNKLLMEALCQLAMYIDAKNYKYGGNDIWLLKATTSRQATLYDTFSCDRVTSVSLSLTAVPGEKSQGDDSGRTEID